MIQIPLQAVPSQTFSVNLDGQDCQINLYSKFGTLYTDVYVNNAVIILGVQCQNGNRIVRSQYLGFIGDLIFVDTQGEDNPTYDGLGSRYLLEYLTTDDLALLGFAA